MPDILWSLTAERDLSRMPAAIRESLITRVGLLREYPLLGKALQGEWRAFRQLVVSGYGVVYQLLPENRGIFISYIRFPPPR
jgi:mRNA-degrading endonuclease RelE of RelBE toxin-antitoxin system